MSAPPPPPPGYAPEYRSKTKKGVKFFYYSLILYIIFMLLTFILAIVVFTSIPAITATDAGDEAVEAFFGLLIILGTVACIAILILIAVLVFLIIGSINVNSGKHEFSQRHSSSVNIGILFFVLTIVAVIAGIVVPIMMMPSSFTTDMQESWDSIRNRALVQAVISLMTWVFGALMYTFMIKEISLPEDKGKLSIGFLLILIGGIISVVVTVALLPDKITDLSSDELAALATGAGFYQYMGSIVAFIGLIFFLLAYSHTLSAMRKGQIVPSGAPQGPPGGAQYPPPPGGAPYPPPPPPPPGY
jgi:MFS family permease